MKYPEQQDDNIKNKVFYKKGPLEKSELLDQLIDSFLSFIPDNLTNFD